MCAYCEISEVDWAFLILFSCIRSLFLCVLWSRMFCLSRKILICLLIMFTALDTIILLPSYNFDEVIWRSFFQVPECVSVIWIALRFSAAFVKMRKKEHHTISISVYCFLWGSLSHTWKLSNLLVECPFLKLAAQSSVEGLWHRQCNLPINFEKLTSVHHWQHLQQTTPISSLKCANQPDMRTCCNLSETPVSLSNITKTPLEQNQTNYSFRESSVSLKRLYTHIYTLWLYLYLDGLILPASQAAHLSLFWNNLFQVSG